MTAPSQNQRVGETKLSCFSGGRVDEVERAELANMPPTDPMLPDHTQRCQQGDDGFEGETSTSPGEFRRHLITESSSGDVNGRGSQSRKEVDSPTSPNDFPCEDGSSSEHVSEQCSAAAVLDEGDEDYGSNGSNGILAVSSSIARRQFEAEPRALDSAAAPPEARLPTGHQRSAVDDCVKTVPEKLDNAPLEQAEDDKSHHVTCSGEWGQTREVPDEPQAIIGTNAHDGEGQEAVEGEIIDTGNGVGRDADTPSRRKEIRAAVVGNGTDDEASADATSFVKDDDVSGSDDEFGKEVAKYVGEQQQQQHRRQRRQSGEGDEGERSSGRGRGNKESRPGESFQLIGRNIVHVETLSWS